MTLALRDAGFLVSTTNELWNKAGAFPSLDLRFAENKSLVDATTGQNLVTFTRASSGTFVGSNGVLGRAVTNLLLRSEEFDNAGWGKDSTVATANQTTAPNGTVTADKVAEDTSTNFHAVSQYVAGFASGAVLTLSIHAKAAGRSLFRIQTDASGGTGTADFNLSTVTATSGTGVFTAGSIQAVSDGWYRCSVRCTTSTAGAIGLKVLLGTTTIGSYTGDGTSGVFLWGAQLEQSTTVGEYIPTTSTINSAPRFDHNPTTGESLGLLVEEQRTNSLTNNTMVGAVAGTPGTLPTGWAGSSTANGITREIVGTGTEDGIAYIDLRFSGTNTLGSNFFQSIVLSNSVVAATGQTWTGSAYVRLLAGAITGASFTGTGGILVLFGSPSFADNTSVSINSVSSARLATQRYSVTRTFTNVTTTGADWRVAWTSVTGATIDFTLRIGLPQLELGAFATSAILTSTAAATRSADVASITGSAFTGFYRQDEGTVFAECAVAQPNVGANQFVFRSSDNTFNNAVAINILGVARLTTAAGGVFDGSTVSVLSLVANVPTKIAGAYASNNLGISLNGATAVTDATVTIPLTQTRADIGSDHIGVNRVKAGTIRRLTFWPQRLGNQVLQSITQ